MAVWPVPDIVKEMSIRIERLTDDMHAISLKMDMILGDLRDLKSKNGHMADLALKVEAMTGAVTVARDQIAWLCAAADKKL
jgi:hypothetical protein